MTTQTGELEIEDLDVDTERVIVLHDMFIVDDLTDGYSYIIAHSKLGHKLTFMLKGGSQVIVTVDPTEDFELVAQRIAKRLIKSGKGILRLRFDEPSNMAGGV
jgi:hypothetical protein